MEIKQLQYFVVSVDMGSFKKAAEVLYTTQPHISKTIKTLEEEVNMKLLERTSKGVIATKEGEKVYKYASRILMDADKITQVEEKKDTLKVASNHSCELTKIFSDYCIENIGEDIFFQYLEGNVEEVLQKLHKHTADLGFVYILKTQMAAFQSLVDHKRLEFNILKKLDSRLLVGPLSPFYNEKYLDASVLRNIKLIHSNEEFFSINAHGVYLKENSQSYSSERQAIVTTSESMMLNVISKTDLCNVGSDVFDDEYKKYNIRAVPISSMEESIYFGMVKRKRDKLTNVVEDFFEYVKQNLS